MEAAGSRRETEREKEWEKEVGRKTESSLSIILRGSGDATWGV